MQKIRRWYIENWRKSHADSATCSKVNYDEDPESGPKSTRRSKAYYYKDVQKTVT